MQSCVCVCVCVTKLGIPYNVKLLYIHQALGKQTAHFNYSCTCNLPLGNRSQFFVDPRQDLAFPIFFGGGSVDPCVLRQSRALKEKQKVEEWWQNPGACNEGMFVVC